ncbi:unnamed protein product [Urochloa humidicola]
MADKSPSSPLSPRRTGLPREPGSAEAGPSIPSVQEVLPAGDDDLPVQLIIFHNHSARNDYFYRINNLPVWHPDNSLKPFAYMMGTKQQARLKKVLPAAPGPAECVLLMK